VSGSSAPFLYHPDLTFDFRDMLVAASQVDHGATWYRLDQRRKGFEVPVRMHHCDAEATMEIILVCISLNALNICGTVLSARWFTAVKHIFRLNVKKKESC
jgi:hypothetical protein